MQEMIASHVVEVVIAIIGYFIMRTLKKVDTSISSLDETTRQLQLDMKDKTTEPEVKDICRDVSDAAVSHHLIHDHN